ncbi:hypothetical protein EUX98_g3947 [Antrodiella citrinella]|uniref:C2H2-type domain-containing protein n=1 Tax=Antrodiella citrinella TaxID=2447956 RepID=A0A4V3XIR7_9APHY|nr:hypothetical protein EUX98_g3947 [Antrodiella citrinella]
MDSTMLLTQYNQQHRISPIHHHNTSTRLSRSQSVNGIFQPMLTSAQSSFVRSSAPRAMMQPHHSTPTHYIPGYRPSFQQGESPSNRSVSVSSGGTDVSQHSDRQEYDVPVVPSQSYNTTAEFLGGRGMAWGAPVDKMQFSDFPFQGSNMMPHYVPSQKDDSFTQHITDFSAAALPPFYDNHAPHDGSDVSLGSYGGMSGHGASSHQYPPSSNHLTSAVDSSSVSYGFGGQVNDSQQQHMSIPNMQESSYTLGSPHQLDYPSPVSLQYPASSTGGSPTRFVNLAQVSPSPTISPELIFTDLPPAAPGSPDQSCDPRAIANSSSEGSGRNSPASVTGYDGDGFGVVVQARGRRRIRQGGEPAAKRQRRSSFTSSSDGSNQLAEGESGESEKSEDDEVDGDFEDGDDDEDDDDFVLRSTSRQRVRRRSTRNGGGQEDGLSGSATFSPTLSGGRKLAPPVPVPNLTKKSRGRRVPTAPVVISQNGITKNTRTYMCRVNGCGKCFARGEHLKRHVRSIHTNEKPHKCPYPGCGKDFSRHDNLGQHMRVHKNYKPPADSIN